MSAVVAADTARNPLPNNAAETARTGTAADASGSATAVVTTASSTMSAVAGRARSPRHSHPEAVAAQASTAHRTVTVATPVPPWRQ